MTACTETAKNPFFESYNTPHQTVPFNLIKIEHYKPAFLEGIKQQEAEIKAITSNSEAPTFENTILALENSGDLLSRVSNVFHNILSSETTNEMQALAKELSPILSKHGNNITLNEKLFEKVKAVYEKKESLGLNAEQDRLLTSSYESFVRNGANLQDEQKEKYRELSEKLSMLSLQFGDYNLEENNNYKLVLTNKEDLDGLPEGAIEAAKETAKEKGVEEGWVVTLDAPSYIPFMRYAKNRDLRKELYMAYNTKCTHQNTTNTEGIVENLVNYRMELAQLLGYTDYADFVLTKQMAENSQNVYNLLDQLLKAYTPTAKQEVENVRKLAQQLEGKDFELMPWDWNFYANKLMEKDFNFNEEVLRPYFELSRVKEGVFGLATKLYGITFKKNTDIQVYHEDVDAYEIFDKDGKYLAVLYTDFHPRAGKRSGAWMSAYKEQWIDQETGENSRPHITLVMNFTKPTADKPALLTFDEVDTFLHEFGHGLHGIFANSNYESQSGTNVYRDFVELPSQLMENFGTEPEFLNTFAKHYQTGETIPVELIQKLKESENFNVAYLCLRQLSFGYLDMAWHTLKTPFKGDVKAFEKAAWASTQLLPTLEETCMSVQFSHIFAGGYASGYYGYKWAEVLDADAFSLFKQEGIFNEKVAQSFRDNILSKGDTEAPMTLYKRFRGQEPTIDALLVRNGIKK
ncbi:M3 family metallopeptidase [Bacteroides sp. 214]|uniref:M3 family metallopeptidase n=1 Tax=Bacteroides sp. 214 TaxID=2302935 RepID=UPI001EF1D855|nr:M3 family metallopeptidase [Bacteroides sp. 214]